MTPATREAYDLFHRGTLALARVEHSGIRIDEALLASTQRRVDAEVAELTARLKADPVYRTWRRAFGERTKLFSPDQLAKVVFGELGHKAPRKTDAHDPEAGEGGRDAADKAAFADVDLPFLKPYFRCKELIKLRGTYLENLRREVCGGYLHPSFNLNTVTTFRSCVAKGTLIEVVRDVAKFPKGIPIEDVREGDHVYCYDTSKNLTIRRVLWAGRTGTRAVIRLHWSARGKRGFLDVTPEHKIRLANGRYIEACELEDGDHRDSSESRHRPRRGVMALGRVDDRLYPTWKKEQWDHRLVYRCLVGELLDDEVVHHRDGNHLNNTPSNLQKMSRPDHSALHQPQTLTPEAIRRGLESLAEMRRRGEIVAPSGPDSHMWLELSKVRLFRILSRAGGKASLAQHDFDTIRQKAELLGVNLKAVKDRYDSRGRYISRGRLLRLLCRGRTAAMRELGINFYKLKSLMRERGLDDKARLWANQHGAFAPGNHKITKVEWLEDEVDVYDIEVEGEHNFIANEICVHNSSSQPNFHNIPIRNPEVAAAIRPLFVPRKGRFLVEIDYGALEFRIAACFWKDPNMVAYASDPDRDIHRDSAARLFRCDPGQVSKEARHLAKNQFVFPILYGSFYVQCARRIWDLLQRSEVKVGGVHALEHLKAQGVTELGACDPRERPRRGSYEAVVKDCEDDFNGRFAAFGRGKRPWWDQYRARGWFPLMTGFTCRGVYSRNFLYNAPIQGPGAHCLLWSLNRMQDELDDRKYRTLLIGQIHDCILADVPERELQDFLTLAERVMTADLRRAWDWVIVPMAAEADAADTHWGAKKPWVRGGDGVWGPKGK